MPSALLVVYWPDFSGVASPASSRALAPALTAFGAQRRLSTLYEEHCAFVWDSEISPSSPAAAAFRRWGFKHLDIPFTERDLLGLAQQYPELDHVILAMSAERAAPVLFSLRELGREVELWTPSSAESSMRLDGERPLSQVLHLETAEPVGLFVDWTLLMESGRSAASDGHEAVQVRDELLRAASLVGSVVTARLYAPWEGPNQLDVAGLRTPLPLPPLRRREPDPRFAEQELQTDLWRLLDEHDAPRTWIVVSDAVWLPNVVERAHARGIRVLLWPPDLDHVPITVQAEADGCAPLPVLEAVTPRRPGHPRLEITFQPPAPRPADIDGAAEPHEPPAGSHPPSDGRLTPWARLIYYTECALRKNQWNKIAFRKLAAHLAEVEEFGPTPANAMMWLNRAKAEGLLVVDQEVHRADPGLRVTVCRPNPENPAVRAALEVPDRCLRLLHQMLQRIPWVSFKLLRNVLLREQWLGGPPYRLNEAAIDEWLNFLIQDGAIRMTKEANLVNPDYPVTALRMNDDHPLSRAVALEALESTRLGAERAILAVDHFLKRNRKPWMAMSALRRALEPLGREELQAVLQGLQNLGALVTESYPNPQREHFTTGCRLKSEVTLVRTVLGTRDAIIRATQLHQRSRTWVPLSRLDEELATHTPTASTTQLRIAWMLLLRDEGILELDPDGNVTPDTLGGIRCRLNVADAVVRAVVAEVSEFETPAVTALEA